MSTELAIFDKFKSELAAFKAADADRSFDVGNPEGYADCKTYYGKLRKVRNRTNDLRLDTTKGLREEVDSINNEGNEIIAEVDAMADPYKDQMDAEDAKVQAIIDAKAAEAEAKVAYEADEHLAWLEYRERKAQAIIDAAEEAEREAKAKAEAAQKLLDEADRQKEADAAALAKAEAVTAAAIEKVEKDAHDAAVKADKDAADALFQAEKKAHDEKNDLIAKQLKEKNDAQKALDDAAEVERLRVEDVGHRNTVNGSIYRELRKILAPLETQSVLDALVAGQIPHVTINY